MVVLISLYQLFSKEKIYSYILPLCRLSYAFLSFADMQKTFHTQYTNGAEL